MKSHSNYNNYQAAAYIGFLISPVVTLMLSLKNFKMPWVKNIVWAFIAFYSFHFVPPNDGADIWSYANKLRDLALREYSLKELISLQYSEDSTQLDIVETLLTYGVSRVTDNPKVLFLCFGILFGYFYSRNLWFFLSRLKGTFQILSLVGLCLLLVTRPIWGINAFRFHFGVQLFLFGTFNFLFHNNKKGIIFLLLAPFVHMGLSFPVLLTFIYRIVKKFPLKGLFICYFITLFFAELDLEVIRNFIERYSPDLLMNSLTTYTRDSLIENKMNRVETYTITYKISIYIRTLIVSLLPSILYLNRELLGKEKMLNVFSFYLFFGAIANLVAFSSFERYLSVADYMLFGIFLVLIQNNVDFILKKLVLITVPIMLYYAVYTFRTLGIHTFDINHFVNNPIMSFFIYKEL